MGGAASAASPLPPLTPPPAGRVGPRLRCALPSRPLGTRENTPTSRGEGGPLEPGSQPLRQGSSPSPAPGVSRARPRFPRDPKPLCGQERPPGGAARAARAR